MTTSEKITALIAIYGAVLSTIIAIIDFRRDRAKVKLEVSKNMEMIGDSRYEGMTLVMMRATNIGRRPVTITNSGGVRLYPDKNFIATDTRPPLPSEISEGKFIDTIIDQTDVDFSLIDYWAVWDSHGKVHKLQEASLLRHWKSQFQLKQPFRRQKRNS